MQNRPARYYSYLLRFWLECKQSPGGGWRFSLEDPHTGRRQGFTSLEALLAHLQAEMDDTTLPEAGAGREATMS